MEKIILAEDVDNATETTATGWPGGKGFLMVTATSFASATVTLQMAGPDSVWIPHKTAISVTANGGLEFIAPAGDIRLAITGASSGGIQGLYAWAFPIPRQ